MDVNHCPWPLFCPSSVNELAPQSTSKPPAHRILSLFTCLTLLVTFLSHTPAFSALTSAVASSRASCLRRAASGIF